MSLIIPGLEGRWKCTAGARKRDQVDEKACGVSRCMGFNWKAFMLSSVQEKIRLMEV